jgi:hypothetical protein
MFWVSCHMLLQCRMSSKINIPQRDYGRYVMGILCPYIFLSEFGPMATKVAKLILLLSIFTIIPVLYDT